MAGLHDLNGIPRPSVAPELDGELQCSRMRGSEAAERECGARLEWTATVI